MLTRSPRYSNSPPGLDRASTRTRHGFALAGGLAAAFCFLALWRLREVAHGRTGWGDAGLSFAVALLALLALVVVAFASRLGG